MARGWDLLERGTAVVAARLLPLNCVGCDREGVWVCDACESTLFCLPPVWVEGLAPIRNVAAVYSYGDAVAREVVHALKYRYGEGIMGWVEEHIAEWAGPPAGGCDSDFIPRGAVLVPVPLHYRRYVTRGFNQAWLIAAAFGRVLDLPVVQFLKRKRITAPQMGLSRVARLQNIVDAFVVDERVFTRCGSLGLPTMIVVDDVTTTGATLAACAQTLIVAGARQVYGLAFAKEA